MLVENRLFSTLDPRTRQLDLPGGETVLLTDTVGFVRNLPHQVVEAFRSTLEVVGESDLIVHVVDGSAPDFEGQVDAVRTVLAEIGADGAARAPGREQGRRGGRAGRRAGEEARQLLAAHAGSVMISARTGRGIDELLVAMGDRLRVGDRVVELVIPWARGDVLAAVHREGEIVGEVAGEHATRIQVVLDAVGTSRFSRVPGLVSPAPGRVAPPRERRAGSPPRPTPTTDWPSWRPGPRSDGGTPVASSTVRSAPRVTRLPRRCSRPWPRSGTERGYPASAGSPGYRRAAAEWIRRRFGVSVDPEGELAACVGTKEFVASTAQYLRLRTPDRDTVLYPAISYPDLRHGRGARRVPSGAGAGAARGRARPLLRRRCRCRAVPVAVGQLAVEPDRPPHRPRCRGPVGEGHGIPVFSDECYAEFTWTRAPATVLAGGLDGVVAVHSLSKRSNLAGIRAGFFAGDPDLVGFLTDVRRHAGLMIPGPVQAGAMAALGDDAHVVEQRRRYQDRLVFSATPWPGSGCRWPCPPGGFYLWVPVPGGVARRRVGPGRGAGHGGRAAGQSR